MINQWSKDDFSNLRSQQVLEDVNKDVLSCIYCTRLIGGNPELVLHGGGNTSVKTTQKDLFGNLVDVICVKGSGWDMADILPAGLPAIRLGPLQQLKYLEDLSDIDMVNFIRSNLLDATSVNPSVETLSHAFLPHKFVNHSHASAVLSVTNQPNGYELSKEVFGDSFGIVEYAMPGFELAKKTFEIFEHDPSVDGLILLNHGIFTFSDNARTSYDLMIDAISSAENRLRIGRNHYFASAPIPPNLEEVHKLALIIRGACISQYRANAESGNIPLSKFVLEFRSSDSISEFVNGKNLNRYSQAGVATPDHVIRTKNWPMIVTVPEKCDTGSIANEVKRSIEEFGRQYDTYFERQLSRTTIQKTKLDPIPRVILMPGIGLFGVGRRRSEAVIAADLAESFIQTVKGAESIGEYVSLDESSVFDIEYWSLEQSKLLKLENLPLIGNVVVITGGSGTIGAAISNEFQKLGAEIAVLDLDFTEDDDSVLQIPCNVTNSDEVRLAFERTCKYYGGIDVVVSNAGALYQGSMKGVSDETLRQSFDINFFSHQTVIQNAVKALSLQGIGGNLLFNISKQAINPGPEAGPYGIAKAATLALMRQYALEVGSEGIRANAVNADRIRSGLLTNEIISSRALARNVDESDYLSDNILGREVRPTDVAKAFTHLVLSESTVANVTTVDGGNIAAALR